MDPEKTPLNTAEEAEASFLEETDLRKLPRTVNKKTVFVLLLAAVLVLGGIVLAFALKAEPPAPVQEAVYLLNRTDARKVTVSVYGETGYDEKESFTLTLIEGLWRLEGNEKADLNQSTAGNIANTARLQSSRVILEQATMPQLAQYGLDNPQRTIEYTFAEDSVKLLLGNRYSADGGFYARLENSHTVHLITDVAGETLLTPKSTLREMPYLIPLVYCDGVTKVDLSVNGIRFLLEKGDYDVIKLDSWFFSSPAKIYGSDTEVQTFIDGLAEVTPTEYVEGGSLSDYGLDKPYLTVSLYSYSDTVFTLEAGNKSGTARYCRINGSSEVYLIPTDTIASLESFSLYQYVRRNISYYDLQNVRRLRFYREGELMADMGYNGKDDEEAVFTLGGEACDADKFKKTYLALLDLTYEGALPDGYTPSGTPGYSYEIELEDGTVDKVEFFSDSAYRMAIRKNGDTPFYTSLDAAERFFQTVELFAAGQLQ